MPSRRRDALSQGITRYFTGKPCKFGHICERFAKTGKCAECNSIWGLKWREENKERSRIATQKWRQDHPGKSISSVKLWQKNNRAKMRDYQREYRAKNKDRLKDAQRAQWKNWRKNNPERARQNFKNWSIKRRQRQGVVVSDRISRSIRASIKGGKNGRSWESLVGYSLRELMVHLERQFCKDMTWSNIGKWHIDHILPLASFTFSTPDDAEFKAAWALTNLRPLWATANMQKHSHRTLLL